MNEIGRIGDQLQRAYNGDAWHGPSLCALLAGVSGAKASARPIPSSHTIWEIVRHIIAWEKVVIRRLASELIPDLPEAENWPAVAGSGEAAWNQARAELEQVHQQLQSAIAELNDSRLSEVVPLKGYSVYVMLHGVIQHNLYHAGQIALLKKA
jgi:uncharacterized damage-inducible protein DinB